MPVAVPTGRYDLKASVDLRPVFGEIEQFSAVDFVAPTEKILEERLAQLESENVSVRRNALIDLRYFPKDGEVVFPELMACLDDEDPNIRLIALSVMMAYPAQAAEEVDTFIEILLGDESVSMSEKSNAANLLGRYVPVSKEVGEALEKAWAAADGNLKLRMKYAVEAYRKRAAPPAPEQPEDRKPEDRNSEDREPGAK